jgi:MFS family permease
MKYLNLDRVTIIAGGFLLLFIAFNSAANLSAKAMKDDDLGSLGFYSMAVLYFVFAFCSFFSTAIVNKLGTKMSLVCGALCYFFWVFCFLCPAFYADNKNSSLFLLNKGFIYFIVLFSSAVNGFGAGILWVAQGKYIADCAND